MQMTTQEFYRELETVLEVPKASITGSEALEDIPEWDSISAISFIAMADTKFQKQISPEALSKCLTVQDLLSLFPGDVKI